MILVTHRRNRTSSVRCIPVGRQPWGSHTVDAVRREFICRVLGPPHPPGVRSPRSGSPGGTGSGQGDRPTRRACTAGRAVPRLVPLTEACRHSAHNPGWTGNPWPSCSSRMPVMFPCSRDPHHGWPIGAEPVWLGPYLDAARSAGPGRARLAVNFPHGDLTAGTADREHGSVPAERDGLRAYGVGGGYCRYGGAGTRVGQRHAGHMAVLV
jgi:hypothetical protein